jgi:sulfate/thiosulfate transport system ATP-binding protein
VRLDEAVHAPLLAAGDGDGRSALQVTRTRHAYRGFELHQGQSVAVGLRRVHVLPTPLSSFTACAQSAPLAEELSRQPLLAELVARMKTRIAVRIEPALGVAEEPCQAQGEFFGTTVIAAAGDNVGRAEWLLRRGVKDLLVLPAHAVPPQRVLIHWISEAARSATLAVSASVLRHVPAEAVYVGIFPGDSDSDSERHSHGMRELLDARSEAQAAHGLEMRTELHFGDVAEELTRRLAEAPAQMLILGVGELRQFVDSFRTMLDSGRWPVLIVQRGAT